MYLDNLRKRNSSIKIARWVKDNAHSVRETALIFFTLALLAGVVWVSGKDIEPIVYVLGSISTLLFTGPTIARFVLPDIKPVRDMAYDEILDFIAKSNASTDWKNIKTNWAEETFLKDDPRLRIRVRRDDAGTHDKSFNEPWAIMPPEHTAISYWYDLSYDGALIDRFILVSIDGGQAQLPLPDSGTLETDLLTFKVAQLFDSHNTLDKYMISAGLKVRDSEQNT